MIIYLITNKVTGKCYVGQTIKPIERRWNCHGSDNGYLAKSVRKYGKESFKLKILERCGSLESLNKREIYWIKKLNTLVPSGYNLTEGGEGTPGFIPWNKGIPRSDATRKKISLSHKGKNKKLSEEHKRKFNWKGKKHSEESKKKISESKLGKKRPPFSEEWKKNIGKAHKGEKNHWYGKKMPESVRKKMSENHTDVSGKNNPMFGRRHSEETKRKWSILRKKQALEKRKAKENKISNIEMSN